jgi:hypothetical protein
MKKISILVTLILISTLLNGDEIDDIINKINSKRSSKISKEKILSTPSPMPKVEIVDSNITKDENGTIIVKKPQDEFNLTGIINNKAHINGQWVKVGDKVGGYKVVDIMDDSVYLKDGNKSKTIFFSNKDNKIKITIGR